MKILILKDYRDCFYSTTSKQGAGLDDLKIKNILEGFGYEVSIKNFAEVNFKEDNYKGVFVLYQSSEDPNLYYKNYIEDILLGLMTQGAILIPDFIKFRAHHNKVFVEILRDIYGGKDLDNIKSNYFGTYEDFARYNKKPFPFVAKPSEGSKSYHVKLINNKKEALEDIKKISWSYTPRNIYWFIKSFFDGKSFKRISNYRRKFIVQDHIKNLSGDYKIVVYGKKYFVIRRENRPRDFRASGSGLLSFPNNVDTRILDFAMRVFESFSVPFTSIDVGFDGNTCYLLEFQFVMFGQHAVEKASHCYVYEENRWAIKNIKTTAENEFVEAVDIYIKNKLYKS